MSWFHESVLSQEVTEYLDPGPGKKYIDATAGGGGHSLELLKKGAQVLAIDRDPEAIEHIREEIQNPKSEVRNLGSLVLVNGNFSQISEIAHSHKFTGVDGIIFDLGVSSHQLDTPSRGFSFQKEGPLDMRMDSKSEIRAFDLVNNLDQRRLNEIFKTYAGEKLSRPITNAICSARKIKPINSTIELAKIVKEVYAKYRIKEKIHEATRVFQALRIVVNSELLNLQSALPQTVDLIKPGGRLAVISFHSLEDGVVKRFLKSEEMLKVLTKKPIKPEARELANNIRARSAKLRIAEKL